VFGFRERGTKETEGRERGWKEKERKMLVGPTLKWFPLIIGRKGAKNLFFC
jgi:hypothetical protein